MDPNIIQKFIDFGRSDQANDIRKVMFINDLNEFNFDYLWEQCRIHQQETEMPFKFLFVLVISSNPAKNLKDLWNQWKHLHVEENDTGYYCICFHVIHEVH